MPMLKSRMFVRQCRRMANKADAYLPKPRAGIYQYRRRVPEWVREVLPDAPLDDERSLGTESLREAELLRDRRKKLFDEAFLKIILAIEAGKPCPFASWYDIENTEVVSLTDEDLDEVLIPASSSPYDGAHNFNRPGPARPTPPLTLRDVMGSNLADQLNDLLPNLEAELTAYDDVYQWMASARGKQVLASNPRAADVAARLKQATGRYSWIEGAQKRIDEQVPAYSNSRANMLRSYARRLERMKVSPPDQVQRPEIRRLIQRLAEEGLARTTVGKVLTAGRVIARTVFPDDHERWSVWEDHELKGKTTEGVRDFEIEDIEQLLSVQPPSRSVLAVFRVGLYTGARPSEIVEGTYDPKRQLFEVANVDLNDRQGRTRKTRSSLRSIPVHPEIVGDLEFLAANPTPYKQAALHFKKWREAAGITDPALTLNSTRHAFVTHMDRLGVEEPKVMVLNGRTIPGTHAGYKHRKAHEFVEEINRLDWHERVSNWDRQKTP